MPARRRMLRGPVPGRFEKVVARIHRHQVRFFFLVFLLIVLGTLKEWPC